jgi:hypothetical protein
MRRRSSLCLGRRPAGVPRVAVAVQAGQFHAPGEELGQVVLVGPLRGQQDYLADQDQRLAQLGAPPNMAIRSYCGVMLPGMGPTVTPKSIYDPVRAELAGLRSALPSAVTQEMMI